MEKEKKQKKKREEHERPIVLSVIAMIGYGFLAYRMWPDFLQQIFNIKNSGVEGYSLFVSSFFSIIVLVVLLCSMDVLKRIVRRWLSADTSDSTHH